VGNAAIMHYMLSWFRMPVGWQNTVWLSQIQQGVAIKYAVEHWRRNMPRCMGAVYWQLNDCWPVASWASLDYYGRWKALQYLARRFFAPLLVSGVEDAEQGTVEVHVSSDRQDEFAGQVRWVLTDQHGATLESGTLAAEVPRGSTTRVDTLDLALHVEARRGRNLLLWLDLLEDGELASENLVTFGPPKTIDLQEPCLATEVARRDDGSYLLTLTAERPALWAWVELADSEVRAADNFLHVRPGRPAEIALPAEAGADAAEVQQRLIVRSLRDTY
jgi:beta-mannosidase